MSFTGYSLYQQTLIDGSTARLDAAELAIVQNLSSATAKYALLDAKDVEHDQSLSTLSGVKVDLSVYDAKMTALDAKDAEQDGRLVAVENRATALESDISSRVQAEIDSKVSQVVFDTIHAELMDVDSQLTSTLATKVAATVQADLDASQNSTIATKVAIADYDVFVSTATAGIDSKVAQTDYDLYISTNNALVDTKAAQIDLLNLSTGIANRVQARVVISDYVRDTSTLNTRLSGMDANIASRVLASQYMTDKAASDALIDTKLAIASYQSDKSASDALIDTKLATATYTAEKEVQDAVIASKVAQDDYDAYVLLNNAAVNSKVAQSVYDAAEASQNAAIALKADQSALSAYIASNNAAVATKVAQTEYNATVSTFTSNIAARVLQTTYDSAVNFLNSRTQTFESRFNAVEEFIRALLATYTIMRPDNTLYTYTGATQGFAVPPPPFSIIGKRRAGTSTWLLGFQLTDYGYNTMLGDVVFDVALPSLGGARASFNKGSVNGNTKYIELAVQGSRVTDTDNWNNAVVLPVPVRYRNSFASGLYTFTFTQAFFNSLTLLNAWTIETPTALSYSAVTKTLTFTIANPNLIDFVDVVSNGTSMSIQDTSNLFSFTNTTVTLNLATFPVTPATKIDLYVRYDKITGTSNAGFASLNL